MWLWIGTGFGFDFVVVVVVVVVLRKRFCYSRFECLRTRNKDLISSLMIGKYFDYHIFGNEIMKFQSFVDDVEHNVDDISDAHDDGGGDCWCWWCDDPGGVFDPLLLFVEQPFVIIPIILRLDLSLSIRFCRWAFADSSSSIFVNASRS